MSLPALERHRPAHVDELTFGPRRLVVGLSGRALRRLEAGAGGAVQMELLFSCLVRKRLLQDGEIEAGGLYRARLPQGLELSFRPVVAQHCDVEAHARGQPLVDLPLAEGRTLCPRWVYLDYDGGRWLGDFGFSAT